MGNSKAANPVPVPKYPVGVGKGGRVQQPLKFESVYKGVLVGAFSWPLSPSRE